MGKKEIGKLYIFEGIDNVGKSTIIKCISEIFHDNFINFSTYSFPGKEKDTLGALVYDFHHNKDKYINYDLNNISLQLLHVASHIDIIKRCIIPDLENGKIVLLDRSWWSTYAYGIANGISNEQIQKIIAPEIDILKNVQVGGMFLIKRRQESNEYDNITTKKILDAYDILASDKNTSNFIQIVYNDRSIAVAVREILSIIIKKNDASFLRVPSLLSINSDLEPFSLRINPFKTSKLVTSLAYDTYWEFAAKRQDVFFSKIENDTTILIDDPVLKKYKFTNAYRASDRVSQYLIKEVIYKNINFTPEDMIFRIILFKLFNKIDTWETLEKELGEITYTDYKFENYDKILNNQLVNNKKIYSGAYIMPSGKSTFNYPRKHQNNLKLLEYMMNDKISKKIAKVKTLKELFHLMLQYPTLGNFLAFQLSIDINYSELCDFSEMSFVVAGPGACSGIQKCFDSIANFSYEDIIRYMAERQQEEFDRLGFQFKTLWGRPLQLIDCQNLFCETDKYLRVAHPDIESRSGRTRIKQLYKPSDRGFIKYFYPPKWDINEKIEMG